MVGLILASMRCPTVMAQGAIPLATTSAGASPTAAYPVPEDSIAQGGTDASPTLGPAPAEKNVRSLEITEHADHMLLSAPEPQERRFPLHASWDNGLHLESDNQQFNLHIGGIGQIDTVFLIGPQSVFTVPGGGSNGVGNAEATQIRRAILQADGAIFDQFDYSVEFDFAKCIQR